MFKPDGKLLFACVTALTCNSFLLIGFDNGVLGGLISQPAFQLTFSDPDPTMLGLIVSLYEVGCFIGAILTSIFGEGLGRCKSMLIGSIAMMVGAVLQASSYGVPQMLVARIVSGIGMGCINSSAPVYQSEFSPKTSRGRYACAQLSTLNFGIFLSYWVTYAFAGQVSGYAWRVPVILQCIFIIPIFLLSLILPETPRWLIMHDRVNEAQVVHSRIHGSSSDAESNFQSIVRAIGIEEKARKRHKASLFQKDDIGSRRRLLIACGIQFFQQLGGINGIIYYSGTIFSASLGFDDHQAALMSGCLSTWFFVASFIPWLLIDRIGRRPLFLSMISLMAAVFAVQAGLVSQVQYKTDIAHAAGIGAAAMLFIYEGAFTIGFQATVWVYPPEILPLHLRQTGTALATACNWIINFMVVQITPVAINNIGYKYYIIYAIFNASFVPIIYMFFPETKGLELEDMDKLFATSDVVDLLETSEEKSPTQNWHLEDVSQKT